jgi:hypothetical protein
VFVFGRGKKRERERKGSIEREIDGIENFLLLPPLSVSLSLFLLHFKLSSPTLPARRSGRKGETGGGTEGSIVAEVEGERASERGMGSKRFLLEEIERESLTRALFLQTNLPLSFPRSPRRKKEKKEGPFAFKRERSSPGSPLACASAMERYVIVSRAALAPYAGVGGTGECGGAMRGFIRGSSRPPFFFVSVIFSAPILPFFSPLPTPLPTKHTATASSRRSASAPTALSGRPWTGRRGTRCVFFWKTRKSRLQKLSLFLPPPSFFQPPFLPFFLNLPASPKPKNFLRSPSRR